MISANFTNSYKIYAIQDPAKTLSFSFILSAYVDVGYDQRSWSARHLTVAMIEWR